MEPMDQVLEALKTYKTYYLATTDENGNPQVRPFGTITKFEGKLIIQTGNTKNVYRQMMAHPRVALCAMADDGSAWIRVEADAIRDDRFEARMAALDDYPGLRALYAADDGVCEVFTLENVTASFWAHGKEPVVCSF